MLQVYRRTDAEPRFYDGPEVEHVPSVIFAEANRSASGVKR
ncbi:uncharacterized protein SOCE26_032300 [Sorangium cellulosum]|uniref:Uncharacterized protein n=1 Tax=Sorangium cellulosum TaxID=56 RepID=A0A2L0ERA2_SORCE|nr:uncharacterized protein SOCE26_032300 [Sorangium cellulosum]